MPLLLRFTSVKLSIHVIMFLLFQISKYLISTVDLLELFGIFYACFVRVILLCKFVICFLNFLLAGVGLNTQVFIVVSLEVVVGDLPERYINKKWFTNPSYSMIMIHCSIFQKSEG